MTRLSKLMAGLLLGVALFTSSIAPAQAQSLTYVSRAAYHIVTATTTTVVASDAYIVSVVISTSAVGTSFVAKVQNKEGTAKILIPAGTAAVGVQTLLVGGQGGSNALYSKGGIDIITTGTPGVIDVFITYYRP